MKHVEPKKIALVLNKDSSYWRKVIRGLLQSEPAQTGWILHSVKSLTDHSTERLVRWRPDGVLVGVADANTPRYLQMIGGPVVDIIAEATIDHGYPRVEVDQARVGAMAAEHLLERGLRSFAFFGDSDRPRDQQQYRGFVESIHHAYPDLTVHHAPPMPTLDMSRAWTSADDAIAAWLKSIPRPIGLMLSDDEAGLWLGQVCLMADLRIPDDVAMLGVNDDTLNCEMTKPPLTSIQTPLTRLGQEAGDLLALLMAGRPAPPQPIRLEPLAITVRQSTSVLAIDDEHLRTAIRFIEASAHRPIGVEDVLDHVPISRRELERRFRQQLGRTPLQEIRRVHVEQAKKLLAATDAPLQQIADRSGFSTVYHLCRVFRRETGQTAMCYRQMFRY